MDAKRREADENIMKEKRGFEIEALKEKKELKLEAERQERARIQEEIDDAYAPLSDDEFCE